ncbi:putative enoyl-CoA hydratase echA8 [Roseovarius albus]|uniref:Putative enoyl-CoA hydratase echA8 n=1 Tax=Roseovarius albus TaxID=1247867 RepID=A0A1X6Z0W0_9RHOB|nr:crotonase/enoyl-CoA hydratase family protein [Roseovarius albus]SLN36687.1 putative enoyl-CoA hydratase echA8 [Roseovarius albus]
MSDTVLLKRNGPVAEVRLNRPDKHNAVDLSVFEGLAQIGEELRADTGLRAVILTGEGENFCSGIDTSLFAGGLSPKDINARILDFPEGEVANAFQKPAYVWQEIDVPVIAALQGATYGAGTQIALGADFRLAAPDTRMSVMEIKWGIIPDMSITRTLPRLVRADIAKELIFTGRVVEAIEAAHIGLITRIVDDPKQAAFDMADLICGKNPDAIRRGKRLLNDSWTAPASESLKLEAQFQTELLGSTNQMEAIFANLQKRAPNFK